jgi:CHAT domain-containing protein
MKMLVEGLFPKDHLLQCIRDFVLFEEANDKITKKVAKYHQFFAVRLAAEKTVATVKSGDVKSGEGVFGLKRAFILSGAKSLVMSLWSVPSAETTELMTDFYTLMTEGKSKSEALRQAKLSMMKKKPNPFYWGAFVLAEKPK